VIDELDEVEELGDPGGYGVLEPLAGLADMFGQFFDDGLAVDGLVADGLVAALPDEPLEVLLDDELDAVEVPAATPTGAAFFTTTESDADEFVVATCPLDPAGVSAKAAAVAPPTRTPDTPSTAIAYLSFGRILDITSLL
jgi:hypothetical protein